MQAESYLTASWSGPPDAGLGGGADGRVRIPEKTNLPHGMELMLGLRGTSSKYFSQAKGEVIDGRMVSSWFSEGSKPLRSGTYEIEVSSPLSALQPQAVRAVIGQTGESRGTDTHLDGFQDGGIQSEEES